MVEPALEHVGLNSQRRMRLVIGTGLAESHLKYIDQIDKYSRPGPAYGLFQMEAATHDDIWANFLSGRQALRDKLKSLIIPGVQLVDQLHGNDYYAAAMCGIFYLRFREALPMANDLDGMAYYWKRYYNTNAGKGTPADFKTKAGIILQL